MTYLWFDRLRHDPGFEIWTGRFMCGGDSLYNQ